VGSYYANNTTGNDANAGTILAPKKNLTGATGLLSVSYGSADSSQPSTLHLARDSVWLSQRMTLAAGQSAAAPLFVQEYGAGDTRPTINYQNTNFGVFAAVVTLANYNSVSDIRVINVGPLTGHTTNGSRAFQASSVAQARFYNCEADWISENGFVLNTCSGANEVKGCVTHRTGIREHSAGGTYAPPFQILKSPDVTGSGTAAIEDNVVDRGVGEGISIWQTKNATVSGGIAFAVFAAHQSLNVAPSSILERTLNYGTTETLWHRYTGYTGYGISCRIEHENGSPGNDSRASTHTNITVRLNLVAFCGYGIDYSTQNVNSPATHRMNVDQNTFVDNRYNFAMNTNNSAASAGSTWWNNSGHIYQGGVQCNPGGMDPPSGLNIGYTNWTGSLATRDADVIKVTDPGSPFQLTKQTGWQSINDVTDLGAWSITDDVLDADPQADNFKPLSDVPTVQALANPANDWYGTSGLASPGAISFTTPAGFSITLGGAWALMLRSVR
jgi:hypothetical protein